MIGSAANIESSSSAAAQNDISTSILKLTNPEIEALETEARSSTQNVALLMKGLSFLSKVDVLYENVQKVMSRINLGGYPSTVFTPLLPQTDDPGLVVHIIEDINTIYPSMTQETLAEIFNQQYASGGENSIQHPGRWVLLNSYMAMLLQWKVANSHRQDFATLEWAFLKNAYCVFSDVIIRGKDLLSCQGLVFLMMAMQGNADVWTSYHVLSAAARLAQFLGLNRRSVGKAIPTVEDEQSFHTFWLIYILDVSEALKSGLSPCIPLSEVCSELPDETPTDGIGCVSVTGMDRPLNVFSCRAKLAVIQAKIHQELFSELALQQSAADRFVAAETLHNDLEAWKNSLAFEIRPFSEDTAPDDLEPQIILLHFTYYSCIWKVVAAKKRLHSGHSSTNEDSQNSQSDNGARVPMACIDAARGTIRLLRYMDAESFTFLW